ncbi:TPA: toprim domain-containing protein [Streptococcus suis]|nr:toprim domain-containing protein [Streptococcus suis]HEM3649409.1 toprim domain-containing protein [Streptococcus suis]
MVFTKAQAKALSILEVAKSLGMEMERSSHKEYYWKEHDSFKINMVKNTWNWYSRTGKYGDTINLVQEIKGVSYKDAMTFLETGNFPEATIVEEERKPFRYTLAPYEKPFRKARSYLKETRGLSDETIDFFLKKGVLAEASYRDRDGYVEDVLVFKFLDRNHHIVGASLQGLSPFPDRHEGKGYLKKIMYQSEGIAGLNIAIGSPKRLIVAEAPIDLMSYYELHKYELEDVCLVAMDGLKEGTLSRYAMEVLQERGDAKEVTLDYTQSKDLIRASNFLSETARLTNVFHDNNHQDFLTLAVDNDKAGQDFIDQLQEKKIPVVDGRPPKATTEEKMDWNAYLQLKKKGQLMEHQNKRLTQNKEVEPHRKETKSKKTKTAEEHYFDWIERMAATVQEQLQLPSPPKLASELEAVVGPFITTDLDRLFARRLSLALDTQRVESSQILSVHQAIDRLDKQISERMQEQTVVSVKKEKTLEQAQGQEMDRTSVGTDSLQPIAEGSIKPVSHDTFEQTVTSHPTSSYPLLHFSTNFSEIQRRIGNYHPVTEADIKRLNQYAPSIQSTAQWYLNELADQKISYVYLDNGQENLLQVDFKKENFIHLVGIRPIEDGKQAGDFLVQLAQGEGNFNQLLISNSIKYKLQVLPMLPDILDSHSFILNDLSSVEKLNRLNFSEAIQSKDEDFLLLFRESENGTVPASLMKLKGELATSVQDINEKVVLGVYRERGGIIEQLSIHPDYVKDGGQSMMTVLQNKQYETLSTSQTIEEEKKIPSLSSDRLHDEPTLPVSIMDSDADGISDEEELKQGTNPYDFRSQPTTKNQEEREEQEVEDSSLVVANLIQNQDIAGLNRHLKEGIKSFFEKCCSKIEH